MRGQRKFENALRGLSRLALPGLQLQPDAAQARQTALRRVMKSRAGLAEHLGELLCEGQQLLLRELWLGDARSQRACLHQVNCLVERSRSAAFVVHRLQCACGVADGSAGIGERCAGVAGGARIATPQALNALDHAVRIGAQSQLKREFAGLGSRGFHRHAQLSVDLAGSSDPALSLLRTVIVQIDRGEHQQRGGCTLW